MKFKSIYRSCFWCKTDIGGELLKKKKSFLRIKWDKLLGILSSRKRRRHQRLCRNHNLLRPTSRANLPYKFPRWAFKNSLSNRICIKRFYGDFKNRTFKRMCKKVTGVNELIRLLEARLDINLYRLGFFPSIYESQQAILHGKILVNGSLRTLDHLCLKSGDLVEFCPKYRGGLKSRVLSRRKGVDYLDRLKLKPTPNWIQTDYSSLSFVFCGKVDASVFYPFRAELDEILNSVKYRY